MQKEFSYPIKIEELGQGTQSYVLRANEDQLKYLAEILKVPAVNSFKTAMKLFFQKKQAKLEISGNIEANLKLVSVISLIEFNKDYKTEFHVTYDTNAKYDDIYTDDEDINLDIPDIVIDGKIDLGDIAIEQLALVMEDHPRMEGESFNAIIEDNTPIKNNPFIVLEKLKK